jgi:hypothetical protein
MTIEEMKAHRMVGILEIRQCVDMIKTGSKWVKFFKGMHPDDQDYLIENYEGFLGAWRRKKMMDDYLAASSGQNQQILLKETTLF